MKLAPALMAFLLATPQAVAAPLDPEHRQLADLAGHWRVTQSFWTMPGGAPKVDKGEAEFAMILNQRHLRQTLRIADGTGFEGLGFIGYDNAAGTYFSTWMDVNFPGLVVARGAFDPAVKAYVFRGGMSTPGGEIPVREVMTVTDADHFTYEYFETQKGRESLTVRLDYTRVAPPKPQGG